MWRSSTEDVGAEAPTRRQDFISSISGLQPKMVLLGRIEKTIPASEMADFCGFWPRVEACFVPDACTTDKPGFADHVL
jgi:hypothetical protein